MPVHSLQNHVPALDGLRAIAILTVVFSHAGSGFENIFPGTLGVIVFFVISGFLITSQLAAEMLATGQIAIGRFYLRRILRLMPSLIFYLIIFMPVLSYLGTYVRAWDIISGITCANYYHIFIGYAPYNPIPILWSLSVEEHYYVFFPFIMLATGRNPKNLAILITSLIVVALLWRIIIYDTCLHKQYFVCGMHDKIRAQGTDTIFDTILYGSLIALALQYCKNRVIKILANNNAFIMALCVLAASIAIRNQYFRETLRYSLQAASCAVILVNVIYGKPGWTRRILENRVMLFIGQLSYPLYLLHFGILLSIEEFHGSRKLYGFSDTALYLLLSFILACCCYFLIERPLAVIRLSYARFCAQHFQGVAGIAVLQEQ